MDPLSPGEILGIMACAGVLTLLLAIVFLVAIWSALSGLNKEAREEYLRKVAEGMADRDTTYL